MRVIICLWYLYLSGSSVDPACWTKVLLVQSSTCGVCGAVQSAVRHWPSPWLSSCNIRPPAPPRLRTVSDCVSPLPPSFTLSPINILLHTDTEEESGDQAGGLSSRVAVKDYRCPDCDLTLRLSSIAILKHKRMHALQAQEHSKQQ